MNRRHELPSNPTKLNSRSGLPSDEVLCLVREVQDGAYNRVAIEPTPE